MSTQTDKIRKALDLTIPALEALEVPANYHSTYATSNAR